MKKLILLLIIFYCSNVYAQAIIEKVIMSEVSFVGTGIERGTLPVIYTLGDSITVGYKDNGTPPIGWRGDLQQDSRLGKSFEFVGPWGTIKGTSIIEPPGLMPKKYVTIPDDITWQLRHGGWGGVRIEGAIDFFFDYNMLTRWLPKPIHEDTTLIIILGVNDSYKGLSVSSRVGLVEDLITDVNTYDPAINILVADGIPIHDTCCQNEEPECTWMSDFKTEMETKIPAIATLLSKTNLYLMPVYDLFTDGTKQSDCVHPNRAGNVALADLIYTTMQNYIN